MTDSDIKPALKRWHYTLRREVDLPPVTVGNAKAVRAFREVTEYCSMPSKQYLAAAHPTGGHVTQSEHHRRGRHVLLGVVVDQQEQTFLTKLLGCCQQCHRSGDCVWHPGSHGGRVAT